MEKITGKVKNLITWGGWLVAILVFIWSFYGEVYKFEEDMRILQKTTLRNTIWNENIPMHDRLESCDSYLQLGYNSETKKYCNELLERNEY